MPRLSDLVRFGPFQQKGFKTRRLNSKLEDVLERRFGLTAWELDRLRYAAKPLQGAHGRMTRRVVVFDPTLLDPPEPASFEDLSDRKAAVLFTGSIDDAGRVSLKAVDGRKWPGPVSAE